MWLYKKKTERLQTIWTCLLIFEMCYSLLAIDFINFFPFGLVYLHVHWSIERTNGGRSRSAFSERESRSCACIWFRNATLDMTDCQENTISISLRFEYCPSEAAGVINFPISTRLYVVGLLDRRWELLSRPDLVERPRIILKLRRALGRARFPLD